jgi:hypothetical protein
MHGFTLAIRQNFLGDTLDAADRLDVVASFTEITSRQSDFTFLISEVNLAIKAFLIAVNQMFQRIQRQPYTGCADELTLIVKNPVIDEDRDCVVIGEIQIDIGFVGGFEIFYTKNQVSRGSPSLICFNKPSAW